VEKFPDNREHPIRDVRAYRLLVLTKQGFLTYNFIHVSICSYSVSLRTSGRCIGCLEVQIHSMLTSALDGGKPHATAAITPRK